MAEPKKDIPVEVMDEVTITEINDVAPEYKRKEGKFTYKDFSAMMTLLNGHSAHLNDHTKQIKEAQIALFTFNKVLHLFRDNGLNELEKMILELTERVNKLDPLPKVVMSDPIPIPGAEEECPPLETFSDHSSEGQESSSEDPTCPCRTCVSHRAGVASLYKCDSIIRGKCSYGWTPEGDESSSDDAAGTYNEKGNWIPPFCICEGLGQPLCVKCEETKRLRAKRKEEEENKTKDYPTFPEEVVDWSKRIRDNLVEK